MLHRFDHVTISVRDVAAAAKDYEKLLGRPAVWRGGHPELGARSALFGVGNALIELSGPDPTAPEAEGLRAALDARGEGLQALAFGSEDAAACSQWLRSRSLRATPAQAGEARAENGALRHYQSVELGARSTRGVSLLVVERADFAALAGAAGTFAADAVSALDHVVVRSADLDAALAVYGAGLGIRLALDKQLGGRRMLFFRVGGVTIEVVHDAALGDQDVLWGVAYRVRDIAAAHARLAAVGCDVSELRQGAKPGTQVFTVRAGTAGVPTLVLFDPSRA